MFLNPLNSVWHYILIISKVFRIVQTKEPLRRGTIIFPLSKLIFPNRTAPPIPNCRLPRSQRGGEEYTEERAAAMRCVVGDDPGLGGGRTLIGGGI